jgi:hypothetical protein
MFIIAYSRQEGKIENLHQDIQYVWGALHRLG